MCTEQTYYSCQGGNSHTVERQGKQSSICLKQACIRIPYNSQRKGTSTVRPVRSRPTGSVGRVPSKYMIKDCSYMNMNKEFFGVLKYFFVLKNLFKDSGPILLLTLTPYTLYTKIYLHLISLH
jgi:hypothetical protein